VTTNTFIRGSLSCVYSSTRQDKLHTNFTKFEMRSFTRSKDTMVPKD